METFIEYNQAVTLYFPLITLGSQDFQTTWTPATGETQYSIDGAAFGNTTNNPAHEGNGIWSLALVAAETQGTRIAISIIDAGSDVEDQAIICNTIMSGQINATKGIITGEVDDTTFTPTTTALEGFRTSPNLTEEATADHYNGRLILFTSGALLGQMSDVTDYVLANSLEKFTYSALTEAPSDGDTYVIL